MIRVARQSFPQPAAMDTAISHALLRRASEGTEPETLRIHRARPIVAFGPLDRVSPHFAAAVAAAREHGFEALLRLAGGRAAVFHEDTLSFSWAIPDPDPRPGISRRFVELAQIMAEAFQDLGVDARVGAVPGEYCPGEHSVNARGATKLMGVGQRLVHRAAHVGGVVVVAGGNRVRDVLVPVYEALGLAWDPATAGSLRDEVPGLGWDDAARAILDAFASRHDLYEEVLPEKVLTAASKLVSVHAVTV
jgi:octanoyl-[GcvH]:protein N-octanoyltransferase